MTKNIYFDEFKTLHDSFLKQVPKISKDSFTYFLGDNSYDGYLNGFIEYGGIKYAFEIVSDYITGRAPRIFAVTDTTQFEIDETIERQAKIDTVITEHPDIVDSNGNLTPFWKNFTLKVNQILNTKFPISKVEKSAFGSKSKIKKLLPTLHCQNWGGTWNAMNI